MTPPGPGSGAALSPSAKPELPPPGRRSGEGAASILPYLMDSLRAKPVVPAPPPLRPSATQQGAAPQSAPPSTA
jgi:hypothetical protein